jgi:hypothetical protein
VIFPELVANHQINMILDNRRMWDVDSFESITVNKAALTNILEEIYQARRKKYCQQHCERLADRIFAKVKLAQADAKVKEILGIEPL